MASVAVSLLFNIQRSAKNEKKNGKPRLLIGETLAFSY
ncbi:hypothetical protein NOC27_1385 [Nitrosococcus oceani AFC27]|nr:hypothetical protein NOC27_1385 [Nitrosococcus oceani AFC27]